MASESRVEGAAVAAAATAGRAGPPRELAGLEAALRRSPTAFDFFQAVRTLERLRPGRAAIGEFVDPAAEVVRFTVNPSISFPPAEIHALELPESGPARMSVNFFGLTGPLGVLPYQYTLLLAERLRARDTAPAAFFDLFHHRIISLFYRAWEKNRFTVCYEKQRADRVSEHLLDLIGEPQPAAEGAVRSREALLFYAGLLGPEPRGAIALEQLLEDMFDTQVEVQQFVGGWFPLGGADQCALGAEDDASSQLGLGAVAGDEVWDQQARVRIRIGPLDARRYTGFLPGGEAHARLRELVRFFSRDAFDFEVQLVLARDDVPPCVLGDDAHAPQPLGWSTWMRTEPFTRDADETVLTL